MRSVVCEQATYAERNFNQPLQNLIGCLMPGLATPNSTPLLRTNYSWL